MATDATNLGEYDVNDLCHAPEAESFAECMGVTDGPDLSELEDEIIEDTVHCSHCNASFVLGDNEPYVILDATHDGGEQLKLCGQCAEKVAVEVANDLRRKLAAIRDAMAKIVIFEGTDSGVILLSSESPTYYDLQAKCQVYKHEHFSPLGDAIVAVARMAEDDDSDSEVVE